MHDLRVSSVPSSRRSLCRERGAEGGTDQNERGILKGELHAVVSYSSSLAVLCQPYREQRKMLHRQTPEGGPFDRHDARGIVLRGVVVLSVNSYAADADVVECHGSCRRCGGGVQGAWREEGRNMLARAELLGP